MSETYVNQVTLDCLLNRELIESHLKSKMSKSVNRKDKKFYRKRIYNLVKELLIVKDENMDNNIPPDVRYAFDNFVKTCVVHFKNTDTSDIIQSDYKNIEESVLIGNDIPELNDDKLTKEDADKLLLRTIKVNTNSLDHFVKKKPIANKREMILPKQKNIDLKDPALKMKGVVAKDKKKNLNNKYEETKNNKKEHPDETPK